MSKQLILLIGIVVLIGAGILLFFMLGGKKEASTLKPLWEQKEANAEPETKPAEPSPEPVKEPTKTEEAPTKPAEPVRAPTPVASSTSSSNSNDKSCFISGKVQDESGIGIEGAAISLFADSGKPDPNAKALQNTQSDTTGSFQFDSLQPGFFFLEVGKPGFSKERMYGVRLPRKNPLPVVLYPAGSISGTVRDRATGATLAKTLVIVSYQPWDQKIEEGPETNNDAQGAFKFSQLRANQNEILITTQREGYAPILRREPPLQMGENREIQLELAPGVTVSGKTVDDAGTPISGAFVLLEDTGVQAATSRGSSNAKGEFTLTEASPDSTYFLSASKEGYKRAKSPAMHSPFAETTLVLERLSSIAGKVKSPDGAPIAKFTIKAFQEDNLGYHEFETSQVVSDAKGNFLLEKIPPGDLNLLVVAENFAPERVEKLLLTPGAKAENIDVTLKRGSGVFGTVINAEQQPVRDAQISFADRAPNGVIVGTQGSTTQSDERGRFALTGAAHGSNAIWIHKDGLADEIVFFETQKGDTTDLGQILLKNGGAIQGYCKGPKGEALRGFILEVTPALRLDHIRSRADAQGSYLIEHLSQGPVTVSGYYAGKLDGISSLHRFHRTVEIQNGKTLTVDFDYRNGSKISGSVSGVDQLPGESWIVNLVNHYGDTVQGSTEVDSKKEFEIPAVESGEYEIRLRSTMRDLSSSQTVHVYPGSNAEVRFYIGRNKMNGVVTNKTGTPVAGASLTVRRSEKDPIGYHATSNQKGEFSLEGVEQGSYRLEITKSEYAPEIISNFKVMESEAAHFKAQLKAASSIKTLIQTPSGQALSGLSVLIEHKNDSLYPGNGEYEVGNDGTLYCSNWSAGDYALTPLSQDIFPGTVFLSLQPEVAAEGILVARRKGSLVVIAKHGAENLLPNVDMNAILSGAEFQGNALQWAKEEKVQITPKNATSQADGRVRFDGLPEGNYEIQVLSGSHSYNAIVKAGQTTEVFVEL